MDDKQIAFHEAGHTVVGWYFGMTPTHVTLEPHHNGNPSTMHDRTRYKEQLFGEGLLRYLLDSCITVIESASGGCAELKVGVEHENCGWHSDFQKFDQHLKAISQICGYSYDHCWNLTSAMAKDILAEPEIWAIVEDLAARLVEGRSLNAQELEQFLRNRTAARRAERMSVLFDFVTTDRAKQIAQEYEDYKRRNPRSV